MSTKMCFSDEERGSHPGGAKNTSLEGIDDSSNTNRLSTGGGAGGRAGGFSTGRGLSCLAGGVRVRMGARGGGSGLAAAGGGRVNSRSGDDHGARNTLSRRGGVGDGDRDTGGECDVADGGLDDGAVVHRVDEVS